MMVILSAMKIRLAILLIRLIMIPHASTRLSVLSTFFLIAIVLVLAILATPQVLLLMFLMRGVLSHIPPLVEAVVIVVVVVNASIASVTGHLHFHRASHVPINTSNNVMEFTFISIVIMMMYLLPGFRFQLMMIVLVLRMLKFDYITQCSFRLPNQLTTFLMR